MSRDHDVTNHVDKIGGRLHTLRATFGSFSATDDLDEAFTIIHRPGWTTPQEILFVNALIDATERAVEQAQQLRKALVAGINAIGDEI